MVLVLDCNSERIVNMCRLPIALHTYAPISELPSYISTMALPRQTLVYIGENEISDAK